MGRGSVQSKKAHFFCHMKPEMTITGGEEQEQTQAASLLVGLGNNRRNYCSLSTPSSAEHLGCQPEMKPDTTRGMVSSPAAAVERTSVVLPSIREVLGLAEHGSQHLPCFSHFCNAPPVLMEGSASLLPHALNNNPRINQQQRAFQNECMSSPLPPMTEAWSFQGNIENLPATTQENERKRRHSEPTPSFYQSVWRSSVGTYLSHRMSYAVGINQQMPKRKEADSFKLSKCSQVKRQRKDSGIGAPASSNRRHSGDTYQFCMENTFVMQHSPAIRSDNSRREAHLSPPTLTTVAAPHISRRRSFTFHTLEFSDNGSRLTDSVNGFSSQI